MAKRVRVLAAALCVVAGLGLPGRIEAAAAKSTTILVSQGAGGVADGNSSWPSVSADARYVAFSTYADNLVAHDTNGVSDVVVRDLVLNTTRRVSVSSNGVQANAGSFTPAISADGSVIAFQSYASNLVPGDTEGQADTFVHYMSSGRTVRVSVGLAGGGANDDSLQPAISGDGHVVAFASLATNLVAQPVNATGLCCDIYIRNLTTHKTTLVDHMLDGTGSSDSFSPVLSSDGRYAAFGSWGCAMVKGIPCEDESNVFRFDATTGNLRLVTRLPSGGEARGCGEDPAISADGNIVAFVSDGDNLVPNDYNSAYDVFERDIAAGQTQRVSVTSKGAQSNGAEGRVTVSDDGQRIAFQSDAWNLVPNDTNTVTDIFVRDLRNHRTTRVSVASNGAQLDGYSANAAISGDGTLVAFESLQPDGNPVILARILG
jgi:Tol biopolymer transport system component